MEPDGHIVLNTDVKQLFFQFQKDGNRALVIAISDQAAFDLGTDHKIVSGDGGQEVENRQVLNENELLKEGRAFSFMKAVQMVNAKLLEKNPEETLLFDMILVSKSSPQSGSRVIKSVRHYGLDVSRFCFAANVDCTNYLTTNNVKLFLSSDEEEDFSALRTGFPAPLLFKQRAPATCEQLKIMFDGDTILRHIFQENKLEGIDNFESHLQSFPISEDPLIKFAVHLGEMRKKFSIYNSPLNVYLTTTHSDREMSATALRALRAWGLEVDEVFFLNGAPKGPVLLQIQPHVIFDDGLRHL
ncbi:cytosolic 5'-nucleotidase 1B isoform X1 [Polypterus senegalus]|uniref:cytosolic 5'-nucleotidase 1B isoform X1 n=1 Tax=Polypterus senegalus TaxID=55291 RepID=UPI0019642D54|nr:cytosolic 5'-nucleotidase 1B isoform X1 [Polypterus senegalus]XP_039594157.1 cytosolic 5'-nucleotidase 1B isoform X1 [Polypterus senegalus]XP_039594164.1 cytosolic 5'-nucleotidase 1B isoform X1 [Polypterus senegalus]